MTVKILMILSILFSLNYANVLASESWVDPKIKEILFHNISKEEVSDKLMVDAQNFETLGYKLKYYTGGAALSVWGALNLVGGVMCMASPGAQGWGIVFLGTGAYLLPAGVMQIIETYKRGEEPLHFSKLDLAESILMNFKETKLYEAMEDEIDNEGIPFDSLFIEVFLGEKDLNEFASYDRPYLKAYFYFVQQLEAAVSGGEYFFGAPAHL